MSTIISNFSDFRNSIEAISKNLFFVTSTLKMIELLKETPSAITSVLTDPVLTDEVTKCQEIIDSLNSKLAPLNNKLKSQIKKQNNNIDTTQPYAGFRVDEKPIQGFKYKGEDGQMDIFDYPELIPNFEELNKQHFLETGKYIKPVKQKEELAYKGNCPHCNASNEYLYDNNKCGQYLCKACKHTFSVNTRKHNEISNYCPHCTSELQIRKDKKNYFIYRCENDNCSFYKSNKKLENKKKKNERCYAKLRYIYREFKFTINDVNKPQLHLSTKVDLTKAHHSPKTIGTILTLYINYGLSSHKSARFMYDQFNIKVSHQTVLNYAEAASSKLQYIVSNYKYNLGDILTGDETYIKALGKNKYVFFFSDTINKIITSYKIYDNRDTKSAVESLLMSFNKYEKLPNNLTVVTDANPIYNAAQLFLSLNDINFTLQQVVGVSNKDEVSTKYRSYKQAEERLNRTYKQNYYGTTGYKSLNRANQYMVLYVAFFNFLRVNSSLNYNVPVHIDEIQDCNFMYDKWINLINLSESYIN